MKKTFFFAMLAMGCVCLMTGCNSDKFQKTDNGLLYRFETVNNDGAQPQMGDRLVVELTLKLDTTLLFSNVGKPDRLLQVGPTMFKGDLNEGLPMMHKGDKAVFGVPADSMATYIRSMPPSYRHGEGQYFYYEISLVDIVTKEELEQEEANFLEEMKVRKAEEPEIIAQYLKDHGIKTAPTASGLYVVIKKKGMGAKVEAGKTVSIDYTGRFLDGTLFDTSRETDAKEAGRYVEGRDYKPLTYKVGAQPLIKGWDEGVMNQPAGTEMTLIMPSSLAYGEMGTGAILPYTPLMFDITIVSVK